MAVLGLVMLRDSTYDEIVAAGERTAAAGTARVAITAVADGGVGRPKQRIDSTGLVDFREGASHMEVRMGEPRSGGELEAGDVAIVVLHDGTDSYARLAMWPDEQPWVPLGSTDEVTGAGVGVDALLADLRPGVLSVEELGQEDVRGVSTTRHRITVDRKRLASSASELVAPLVQGSDSGRIVVNVWVADDGLRRIAYDVGLGGTGVEGALGGGSPTPANGDMSADPSATPDASAGPDSSASGATMQIVVEYFDQGVSFDPRTPDNVAAAPEEPDAAATSDTGSAPDTASEPDTSPAPDAAPTGDQP